MRIWTYDIRCSLPVDWELLVNCFVARGPSWLRTEFSLVTAYRLGPARLPIVFWVVLETFVPLRFSCGRTVVASDLSSSGGVGRACDVTPKLGDVGCIELDVNAAVVLSTSSVAWDEVDVGGLVVGLVEVKVVGRYLWVGCRLSTVVLHTPQDLGHLLLVSRSISQSPLAA